MMRKQITCCYERPWLLQSCNRPNEIELLKHEAYQY